MPADEELPARRGRSDTALEVARNDRERLFVLIDDRAQAPLREDPNIRELLARKRNGAVFWGLLTLTMVFPIFLPLNMPLLVAALLGASALGTGGMVINRASGYRALSSTVNSGVPLNAEVTDHDPGYYGVQSMVTPVATLQFEYGGRERTCNVELANPDKTHPVGSTVRIIFNPQSGHVFVPDEYGLRLEQPALPPVHEDSAPETERVEEPDSIFGSEPSITEAWPPPELLTEKWEARVGGTTLELVGDTLSVLGRRVDSETAQVRPVRFDLEGELSVNMGRTEAGEVLVSMRQRQARGAGWLRWQFAVAAASWESITGEASSRLPRQALPDAVLRLSEHDAGRLLAHIRAMRR